MSSAKNHARRSRRGYRMQKSITGGCARKVWISQASGMHRRTLMERWRAFRRAMFGRRPEVD